MVKSKLCRDLKNLLGLGLGAVLTLILANNYLVLFPFVYSLLLGFTFSLVVVQCVVMFQKLKTARFISKTFQIKLTDAYELTIF